MYKFTNEHGEKFEIELLSDFVGKMKGDETGWKEVYLVNGYGSFLFSDKERIELEKIFPKYHSDYFDLDTEFTKSMSSSFLENNYCPLCLEQKEIFQGHHVYAAMNGGSDKPENILQICQDCHALESFGSDMVRHSYHWAAKFHQLWKIGFEFFEIQLTGNSRYSERKIEKLDPGYARMMKFLNTAIKTKTYDELNNSIGFDGISMTKNWQNKYEYFVCLINKSIPYSDFWDKEKQTK